MTLLAKRRFYRAMEAALLALAHSRLIVLPCVMSTRIDLRFGSTPKKNAGIALRPELEVKPTVWRDVRLPLTLPEQPAICTSTKKRGMAGGHFFGLARELKTHLFADMLELECLRNPGSRKSTLVS